MSAMNSYHAMNRIISFYPLENRPTLLLDLSAALQAIVSQRLVRTKAGSQTFEQGLFKMFMEGAITQEECMANADSTTGAGASFSDFKIDASV